MTNFDARLGGFLRSRRERLRPQAVGLADGRRRRTPGLKREEVASLAGISAEWYVKLEQGRAVSPSPATLEALARALRLDKVEREHLRALAEPKRRAPFQLETVPSSIRRLVESLPHPAYVTGRRWDVLIWNAAAADLFGDFGAFAPDDCNMLLHMLVDPRGRALFGESWPHEARRMVALFRASYDLAAGDPTFLDLISRLRAGCPEFEGWWSSHDVGAAVSGRKILHHPVRGELVYDYASFQANDNPALKFVAYMPA